MKKRSISRVPRGLHEASRGDGIKVVVDVEPVDTSAKESSGTLFPPIQQLLRPGIPDVLVQKPAKRRTRKQRPMFPVPSASLRMAGRGSQTVPPPAKSKRHRVHDKPWRHGMRSPDTETLSSRAEMWPHASASVRMVARISSKRVDGLKTLPPLPRSALRDVESTREKGRFPPDVSKAHRDFEKGMLRLSDRMVATPLVDRTRSSALLKYSSSHGKEAAGGKWSQPEMAEVSGQPCLWQLGATEGSPSPELTKKVFDAGDPRRQDTVFVRPYFGRVTDLDALGSHPLHDAFPHHIAKQILPSLDERIPSIKESMQLCGESAKMPAESMDDSAVVPALKTRSTCMTCAIKELRCEEIDGKMVFVRRPRPLCVHREALETKLAKYNRKRESLIRQWAAVRIQALWRGHCSRKRCHAKQNTNGAVHALQRVTRTWLCRRMMLRIRFKKTVATLTIQRVFRGFLARKAVRGRRKVFNEGAQHIQRLYRGHLGRLRWKVYFKEYSFAAVRIQAAYAGMKDRSLVREKRRMMNAAAAKIQAGWRGLKGRRFARNKFELETEAALMIQRCTRSWLARTWMQRWKRKRDRGVLMLQRAYRGKKGRDTARHERFLRNTAAAVQVQKMVRGMLGRLKWYRAFRTSKAILMQRLWRGRLGRRKAAEKRWHRMQMMMFVRKRFQQHNRRVQRRKVATIVVQRVYRGYRGRQRSIYMRRVCATMAMQKWLRITWAKRNLRKGVRAIVHMQTFKRRIQAPLLVIRRHLGMRNEAMQIATASMNELGKIMEMEDYFDDPATHPHEQRLEVAKVFAHYKVTVRRLYLKYSMLLVNSPDKAFQMSRAQFVKFVKDSGIFGKTIDARAVEDIFTQSNMDVPKKTEGFGGSSNLLKAVAEEEAAKKKAAAAQAEGSVMMPDEFCEALILLTNRFLGVVKLRPLGARLRHMFDKHFCALDDSDFSPPDAPGLEEEGGETQQCLEEYGAKGGRIEKCFKYYSGGDSIDCVEWMTTCKACNIIDANTSFSKVLEIFLRCNQDELEEYFTDMPNPEEIKDMSLELDEFVLAIVATANLQTKKKPKDTFVNKLQMFLDKLLTMGPKKFLPEVELVKEWEK